MNYETITIGEFLIIGISLRTNNSNGNSQEDIGNLWTRFFGENLIAKIPNKISDEIYCMYTDYESDYTGDYTTILGCKVSSLDNIPDDFVGKTISPSTYRKYKAIGKIPESVGSVWMHIWQSGLSIDRTYQADFDVYGVKSQNGDNSEVDVYLSVK
jgi:predicted transcriptional regulator YdeE